MSYPDIDVEHPHPGQLLTSKEAAGLLRAALTSIWRMRKDGRLLAKRIPGVGVRFLLSDVLQLINEAPQDPAPKRQRGRPREY